MRSATYDPDVERRRELGLLNVPEAVVQQPMPRFVPSLDPIHRTRLSNWAKWMLLVGICIFVVWYPARLFAQSRLASPDSFDRHHFNVAWVTCTLIFCTLTVTAVP